VVTIALHIFLVVLLLAGTFCTIVGIITVFYWFKAPQAPAGKTNRLNNIASWWIGLTRPNVLATSYKYFRNNVLNNINAVEKSNKEK
jgi:hypothetical protein